MVNALLWGLLPVLATIVGAIVALVKEPTPKIQSCIQHFAAGVVFSVVAVEVLPDIVKRHAPLFVILGFVGGLVFMLAIKSFTGTLEENSASHEGKRTFPTALLIAVAVDITVDGFLVGIGSAAGAKEGLMLTAALTLELLSLGLALSIELKDFGFSSKRTLVVVSSIASILLIGTGVGALVLSHASDTIMETVLSFGLVALLFLVTEELLAEAHAIPETPMMTSSFFVGFLLFLILGMLG